MSKAEKRYLEHFQDGRLRNCSSKEAFLLGYHQAEKDNALTWKDVKTIYRLVNAVADDLGIKAINVNIYEEALKRFKVQKGGDV